MILFVQTSEERNADVLNAVDTIMLRCSTQAEASAGNIVTHVHKHYIQ